jgi:hypothetical protein
MGEIVNRKLKTKTPSRKELAEEMRATARHLYEVADLVEKGQAGGVRWDLTQLSARLR